MSWQDLVLDALLRGLGLIILPIFLFIASYRMFCSILCGDRIGIVTIFCGICAVAIIALTIVSHLF